MKVVEKFEDLYVVRDGESLPGGHPDKDGAVERAANEAAKAFCLRIEGRRIHGRQLVFADDSRARGAWMIPPHHLYVAVQPVVENLVEAMTEIVRVIASRFGPGRVWWISDAGHLAASDGERISTYRRTDRPIAFGQPLVVLAHYFFHEHAGRRWHEAP